MFLAYAAKRRARASTSSSLFSLERMSLFVPRSSPSIVMPTVRCPRCQEITGYECVGFHLFCISSNRRFPSSRNRNDRWPFEYLIWLELIWVRPFFFPKFGG